LVKIIGHPTGREFNKRPEGEADWDKVFEVCRNNNVALEINGTPQRMDMSDSLAKRAIASGCKLVLNSDAHNTKHIERNLTYAIDVARRAHATKQNIISGMEDLVL